MATATDRYDPDYAVPPGWVLKERLDAHGIKPAELARRCGRSAKLISEIVAGKAPVERGRRFSSRRFSASTRTSGRGSRRTIGFTGHARRSIG